MSDPTVIPADPKTHCSVLTVREMGVVVKFHFCELDIGGVGGGAGSIPL